mmetsp:Transcript_7960/g.24583  ORF Transcript_7960/g.24583 Transcript_7960/m.24583 type:complete len:377 (+) Transcript_7960:20-1150(+)
MMVRRVLLLSSAASGLTTTTTHTGANNLRAFRESAKQAAAASFLAAAACLTTTSAAKAVENTEGFETFAAQGGVMEARPSCFMNECGVASRDCFSNPSCLKGVTCLGRCRGEQTCATRCFSRFGSERLNAWLSCTLEEHSCVTTGVTQDTSAFYEDAPERDATFDPKTLEGSEWWKVVGYSPKYDCMACQKSSFAAGTEANLVESETEFRVEKENGGFWQNALKETLVHDRGPQGKASFTVGGKMYGLSFQEQWYVLSSSDGRGTKVPPYVFLAYKGDTMQGPYDGAFVLARDKAAWDESGALRDAVAKVAAKNGLDATQFCHIDNACPSDNVQRAGASAAEQARDKLTWSDVFELTEWFRPGTIPKSNDFDPMRQ